MPGKKKYILWSSLVLVVGALAVVLFFYHSNPRIPDSQTAGNQKKVEDDLKRVNKFLVEKDRERIQSFVERRGWKMAQTGSGLWYAVLSRGNGPEVAEGMYVKLDYEIRLLDGTLCYSSDSTGARVVQVGHGDATRGLHEGLTYLRGGDQARLIMPPHLAHGLIGDGERIPARAILVYHITVLEASREKIRG